jgi:DNA-binding transcriptional LysR family regulator
MAFSSCFDEWRGDALQLRQLEHFVAVAEERHFTRAAARVHVAQSGLSSSIKTLEQEMGVALFVRSTRHVELTDAGAVFLGKAREVLEAAERAKSAVADFKGMLRGVVSLGVMPAHGGLDVPGVLMRFHRAHPGVQLRLREDGSRKLAEDVAHGQRDLAIVSLTDTLPGGLRSIPLITEPMVLACPMDHPVGRAGSVALQDVGGETFVDFHRDCGARWANDEAFSAAKADRRVAFEANDARTVLELVSRGFGLALVPRPLAHHIAGPSGHQVRYVDVAKPAPLWRLGVVLRGNNSVTAAARALLDMLLAASSSDTSATAAAAACPV